MKKITHFWFIGAVLLLISGAAFSQSDPVTPFKLDWKLDQARGHKEIGAIISVDSNYKYYFQMRGDFFSDIGDSLGVSGFLDSVAYVTTADSIINHFYFYSGSTTYGPYPVVIKETITNIRQVADTLFYTNEAGVENFYLPSGGGGGSSGSTEWDSILNIPPGFADGIDDVIDDDADSTNEIQILSINGDTIFLSNGGGFLIHTTFSGDWNDLVNVPATFPPDPHTHVEADITNLDHYTDADIDGTEAAFNGWDKNAADDFSGNYTDLDFTGTTGLSDGVDNVDDADNDPTNELYDDQELRDSLAVFRHLIDSIYSRIDTCCPVDTTSPPQPSGFQPTDIANLGLWIDGSDIDGDGVEEGLSEAGLSGTDILNVKDKSGNARHFSQFNGAPQLVNTSGTQYALTFDGDDSFLSDDANTAWTWFHSADITAFIRFEVDDAISGNDNIYYALSTTLNVTTIGQSLGFLDHSSLGHGTVGFNYNGQGSASGRYLYHGSGTTSDIAVDNQYYNVKYFVDHSAATPALRMVCEVDGVGLSNTLDNSHSTSASGSDPTYTMKIGVNGPSSGGWWVGSIQEIIIYERELTPAETTDINDYLSAKYP